MHIFDSVVGLAKKLVRNIRKIEGDMEIVDDLQVTLYSYVEVDIFKQFSYIFFDVFFRFFWTRKALYFDSLYKKRKLPLRVYLVNISEELNGFTHIYLSLSLSIHKLQFLLVSDNQNIIYYKTTYANIVCSLLNHVFPFL